MWDFRPQEQFQLRHRVTGDIRYLAKSEGQLLLLLLANPHRTVTKAEIHQQIWQGKFVSDASITRAVATLRMALDDSAEAQRIIRTEPKVGYFLVGNEVSLIHPCTDLDAEDAAPASVPPPSRVAGLLRSWRVWAVVLLLILNLGLFQFLFSPPSHGQGVDVLRLSADNHTFTIERDDLISQTLMERLAERVRPGRVDFYITSNKTRVYVSCVRHTDQAMYGQSLNFSFDIHHPIASISDEVILQCQ